MKQRFFCISGGGFSASTYLTWFRTLPREYTLELMELPGRGLRKNEPCCTSMDAIVDDLLARLQDKTGRDEDDYYLVGYCFGATVAAYLCARLEETGLALPRRLFLGGAGPTDERPAYFFAERDNMRSAEKFFMHLFPESMIGNPRERSQVARRFIRLLFDKYARYRQLIPLTLEELFPGISANDPDLIEKQVILDFANETERILETDFRISWELPKENVSLSVDITAMAGSEDPYAPAATMERWRDCTTGSFELKVIEGGHTFFFEEPYCSKTVDAVMDSVRQRVHV